MVDNDYLAVLINVLIMLFTY